MAQSGHTGHLASQWLPPLQQKSSMNTLLPSLNFSLGSSHGTFSSTIYSTINILCLTWKQFDDLCKWKYKMAWPTGNHDFVFNALCPVIFERRNHTLGHFLHFKEFQILGSGCGSVGRAVASNTIGPRFESSHRQKFIEHLFTVNCVLKRRK